MSPSDRNACDGGNRTLLWSQFCDGIFDCSDRSDEEGQFCKHCVNNLYSCSSKDDLRCDLACQMLGYVPCQTIQDRRACQRYPASESVLSPLQWLSQFKFHFAVALTTVIGLGMLIGTIYFIRYLIRRWPRRLVRSSSKTSSLCHRAVETDTLSSHLYEQCYDPPAYEAAYKYPDTKTYYEHAV